MKSFPQYNPTQLTVRTGPLLVIALTMLMCVEPVSASEVGYHDPSDVTALVTSLSPVLEYARYENEDAPDDGMWKFKVEGQYAKDSILFLADIGVGYRTGNEESGILDSRVRFFHVPYRNADPAAWVSDLGWSIDSNIPFGDVNKGLGSGNWVFAPGVIWTHPFSVVDVSPNLLYEFTWANEKLKDEIPDDDPNESQALRAEINLAFDVPERYWLLITPAYTWDVENTDDSAFLKVFGGYNISADQSLGLEAQYNFDVRDGLLQDAIRGEKYHLRLHWEIYF